MSDLQSLPNIGKELERQLLAVGISSAEELRSVGSREAWLRILATDPSACPNRLYGLEGAVLGIRRNELPAELKAELLAFVRHHKA